MADWLPYDEVHGTDNTVSGTVVVWPALASRELGIAREILVYLPPSLGRDGPGWTDGRRYPTLYFQDGQNVFDERTAFAGEWHADEILEQLSGEETEAIAVAIPNGGARRTDEYNPWRGPNPFDEGHPGGGNADVYLDWLVGSVKPLIDRSFPTRAEREATGIIGSSMGGLLSMYGLMARAEVFGLAGVMSPSIQWNDFGIVRMIEEGKLPAARIHLDMGGREWRGMLPDARRLRDALVAQGMIEGRDLHYVEERNARHNEGAWAHRLPDALRFLLADFRST